jgi:hypothetical protein
MGGHFFFCCIFCLEDRGPFVSVDAGFYWRLFGATSFGDSVISWYYNVFLT